MKRLFLIFVLGISGWILINRYQDTQVKLVEAPLITDSSTYEPLKTTTELEAVETRLENEEALNNEISEGSVMVQTQAEIFDIYTTPVVQPKIQRTQKPVTVITPKKPIVSANRNEVILETDTTPVSAVTTVQPPTVIKEAKKQYKHSTIKIQNGAFIGFDTLFSTNTKLQVINNDTLARTLTIGGKTLGTIFPYEHKTFTFTLPAGAYTLQDVRHPSKPIAINVQVQ